jgi:hypothetical protein
MSWHTSPLILTLILAQFPIALALDGFGTVLMMTPFDVETTCRQPLRKLPGHFPRLA